MSRLRPWVKWPGAKYYILDRIKAVLPTRTRFVDVFAGGGSVLLNMRGKCLANDANSDLILAWTMLQQHGVGFIDECRELYTTTADTSSSYYAIRKEFNACTDLRTRATLFVYLNRHCFNGLCRYNRDGEFNAAYGYGRDKHFPGEEMLACLPRLTECTFTAHDFRTVFDEIGEGDVVYCDPPYVPASQYSDFDRYHPGSFSIEDHISLANHVRDASARGAHIVVSNSDTTAAHRIYGQASSIETVGVRRHISGKSSGRKLVEEVLFIYDSNRNEQIFEFAPILSVDSQCPTEQICAPLMEAYDGRNYQQRLA